MVHRVVVRGGGDVGVSEDTSDNRDVLAEEGWSGVIEGWVGRRWRMERFLARLGPQEMDGLGERIRCESMRRERMGMGRRKLRGVVGLLGVRWRELA